MINMKKLILVAFGLVLVVIFYQITRTNEEFELQKEPVDESLSLQNFPVGIDQKKALTQKGAKVLKSEIAEDISEASQDEGSQGEVQQTGEFVKVDIKSLLKIMGATDHLTWQQEYDKGIYTASYDVSWKDDMFNRAHELVLIPEFSDDLEISKMECKEDECGLTLRKIPSSKKGGGAIASDYVLALKNHPAIIESGRSRNVYVNSIQVIDGEQVVDLVIR